MLWKICRSFLLKRYILHLQDIYHGIPDIDDIKDCPEDFGLDSNADEDAYWDAYYEHRESWLDYWVEEASGPDDIDEDYQ